VRQSLDILHRLEREMRQAIFSLRPPILDELGLVPSMRRYVESYAAQTGMRVEFDVRGQSYRLDSRVEICEYRILQEALTNTHTHANAGDARITLDFAPDLLSMRIADNGRGFVPAHAVADARFGLLGMRERAEMIGGRLIVDSQPGLGTSIQLWLPIL
jgi:two-component system sensor histidine kinase DegS